MIERKDTPAPFMKRQRQPPPLDIKTTVKHASQSDSPPRTPPSHKIRTRSKRASKAHATPRETYLNGLTDGDNARGGDEPMRNERISHDLSLTDNTRYSVVDNMLLSLNPDQPTSFSTPPDSRSFPTNSRFSPPRSSHRRGHTQSSLATDYTFPPDDSPLRSSGQLSRSHRSNNSSVYQSPLGRIDSIHGEEDHPDLIKARNNQATRGNFDEKSSDMRTLRKSRKSSKSSGASSVDFGHIMGQPRWQSSMERRSSSFDHKHNRGTRSSSSVPVVDSPIVHSISQPLHGDLSDAAPTPTVPVGPRSRISPVFPPQPVHAPPQTPTTYGKNGNKASKYHYSRKNKGEELSRESATMPGADILDDRHESQDIPSVPAFIISRNPSPTRNPQESAVRHKHTSAPQATISSKERPGFFRRVFGTSRNMLYNNPDTRSHQPQSSGNSVRADVQGVFVPPHKLTKSAPAEDNTHPPKENLPPALAKKSSSFFKRRKKSISEHNPILTVPVHLQPRPRPDPMVATTDKGIESSPVSSLREVMNMYLGNSVTSQPRSDEQHSEARPGHKNVISASTLDRNKAAVRPTTSGAIESQLTNDGSGLSGTSHDKEASFMVGNGSGSGSGTGNGTKLKADDILVQPQNSFLHDASSTETRTPRSTDNGETSLPIFALPHQAPTSNPSDMPSSEGKLKIHTTSVDLADDPLQQSTEISAKPRTLSSRSGNISISSANGLNSTRSKPSQASPQTTPTSKRSPPSNIYCKPRTWLDPEDELEDRLRKLERLDIPVDASPLSPESIYLSAASTLPNPGTKELGHDPNPSGTTHDSTHHNADETEPTKDDHILAKRIFEGDESLVPKAKAAAWLGEADSGRSRVRRAYMELFNWQNLNILAALRVFCGQLLLKGETQQVDRLLDAFSSRWCICNPDHGFKATGN